MRKNEACPACRRCGVAHYAGWYNAHTLEPFYRTRLVFDRRITAIGRARAQRYDRFYTSLERFTGMQSPKLDVTQLRKMTNEELKGLAAAVVGEQEKTSSRRSRTWPRTGFTTVKRWLASTPKSCGEPTNRASLRRGMGDERHYLSRIDVDKQQWKTKFRSPASP